jgi:hypothetical protein
MDLRFGVVDFIGLDVSRRETWEIALRNAKTLK